MGRTIRCSGRRGRSRSSRTDLPWLCVERRLCPRRRLYSSLSSAKPCGARARGAGAVGSMQQVYAWLLQTFRLVGGVPGLLAYDDAQEWQLAQVAAARNAAE
jgi:hypothetical protein